jgi:hypothetical protein
MEEINKVKLKLDIILTYISAVTFDFIHQLPYVIFFSHFLTSSDVHLDIFRKLMPHYAAEEQGESRVKPH